MEANGSDEKISSPFETAGETTTHRVHVVSLRSQVAGLVVGTRSEKLSARVGHDIRHLVPQLSICAIGILGEKKRFSNEHLRENTL